MPLIPVVKKEPEPEFKFNHYEEHLRELLPDEQIRAANHNQSWLDSMCLNESRDASPEHTRKDVFKALRDRNPVRILAATKNLTIAERNSIAQNIYYHLLSGKDKVSVSNEGDYKIALQNARILNIVDSGSIDLFDLCVKLEQAGKN